MTDQPDQPGQSGQRAQPSGIDTKRALSNAVASECARGGWRVESQTDVNAILAKGKRTSHGLHIFLSFITLGFWLLVWPVVWWLNREQRLVLQVDEYGNITRAEA